MHRRSFLKGLGGAIASLTMTPVMLAKLSSPAMPWDDDGPGKVTYLIPDWTYEYGPMVSFGPNGRHDETWFSSDGRTCRIVHRWGDQVLWETRYVRPGQPVQTRQSNAV